MEAASDKNVFRLRGHLSRLTGQVRDINPVVQPTNEMLNDESGSELSATMADELRVRENSSGDTDEVETSMDTSLAAEVLGLKQEREHLLACVRDHEEHQITLLRTIDHLENRSASVRSTQSPTRSTVIRENTVLETRLSNFQDQLGQDRQEMAEEQELVVADQTLLQEELMCACEAKVKAEQELEQLRTAFTQEVEDKDTKLVQAKECVNDVKDVVEILAKQLHDNQMKLEQEKVLRTKSDTEFQERWKQATAEAAEARQAVKEAEETIQGLAQTNSELAHELEESTVHSEHVAAHLQNEGTLQHEIKRLNAEVVELSKEIQVLAIANATADTREQELKTAFQKREEALGEELGRLTDAVDEKIEAYQVRENELQMQLAQMTHERDQVLVADAAGSTVHQTTMLTNKASDEMTRLKQMASVIETQRHETLRALELSPGRSPELKNSMVVDKQIMLLETQVMQLQSDKARSEAEKAHYEMQLEECQQAELKRHQHQHYADDTSAAQMIPLQELEMENSVMKEALTKLRRDTAILKADKEEAVVQADTIRGVLRKELDSLEFELKKALGERSRILARSSPARIQELEAQVCGLQQDLEMSVATVSSLDAALRSEQDEKKHLWERLQTFETSASDIDLLKLCHGEVTEMPDPVSMAKLIQSYFGNIQAEISLQHEGDQDLQNSLRTMYNSLQYHLS